MIGAGTLAAFAALWFLWRMRKGKVPGGREVAIAIVLPLLPLAANSFAWIFTEMGRQPWIVYGQQLTSAAVSPNIGMLEVGITVVGFTLLYGVLAGSGSRAAGEADTRPVLMRLRAAADSTDRPAPFAY